MTERNWEFEVGELIVEDDTFSPSFEGAGKVEGGTEYEVTRRLTDESGEAFYFVEEETKNNIKTHLKSAKMVHSLYSSNGMAENDE